MKSKAYKFLHMSTLSINQCFWFFKIYSMSTGLDSSFPFQNFNYWLFLWTILSHIHFVQIILLKRKIWQQNRDCILRIETITEVTECVRNVPFSDNTLHDILFEDHWIWKCYYVNNNGNARIPTAFCNHKEIHSC